MKSCILSMQHVENCGSLLQAYSLKKMLEQCGCEVSFLDIEAIAEDDLLREGRTLRFAENKRGLLVKLSRLDRYTFNRLRIKTLAKEQNALFEEFRKQWLQMNRSANEEDFDCCVIGSDEVFNCMAATAWGFTSQLFGNVRQAERVITYAASCGATKYEDLPAQVADKIRRTFERVGAISVRDEKTRCFAGKLTDKEIAVHCDPVVVGDFDQELRETPLPEGLPGRYCVVYSYYNRISDKAEIREIKAFCKKHQLEIVALGAPQMWIKKYLPLHPFQVLKVFQNAEFVITDTFHGTIFSAKYSRRFASITRPSNENKLADLLERLQLQEHRIQSMEQLDEAFSCRHDLKKTQLLAEQEYGKSIQYLKNNIQKKEL